MRKDLPGDSQWVELLDPDDITRKHIRKVRIAFGKGEDFGERLELGREAILTAAITNWTLEQPVPSAAPDPLDVLGGLSRPVWYALEKIADDYIPNFGDPLSAGVDAPPVDPPVPSES